MKVCLGVFFLGWIVEKKKLKKNLPKTILAVVVVPFTEVVAIVVNNRVVIDG